MSRLKAQCSDDPKEVRRADHQLWETNLPVEGYELRQAERSWSFNNALPEQKIWSYDGSTAIPTHSCPLRRPIVVRNYNDMPLNSTGYGIPDTSTHLHNAHNASESDGNPTDYYASGYYKDFHYPNKLAGDDPREALGFLWFHDHRMDYTAQNVYRGLVGTYILYDDMDCNDETSGFRLPSGEYDVPLVLGDKVFDKNGIAYYDLFNLDGIIGDKQTVNGKIQPFFEVKKRRYRLRLLNTGPVPLLHPQVQQQHAVLADLERWQPAALADQAHQHQSHRRRACRYHRGLLPGHGSEIFLMNVLEHKDGTGPTGNILDPGTRS